MLPRAHFPGQTACCHYLRLRLDYATFHCAVRPTLLLCVPSVLFALRAATPATPIAPDHTRCYSYGIPCLRIVFAPYAAASYPYLPPLPLPAPYLKPYPALNRFLCLPLPCLPRLPTLAPVPAAFAQHRAHPPATTLPTRNATISPYPAALPDNYYGACYTLPPCAFAPPPCALPHLPALPRIPPATRHPLRFHPPYYPAPAPMLL